MRSTDENEVSSRSHLIFSITLTKKSKEDKNKVTYGKLTLIDLAGSESLARIGVDQSIFHESLAINKSLAHLGFSIQQLAKGVPFHLI